MSEYSPEELAAAAGQVQPPPVGTGPAAFTPAPPPAGSVTETDVAALMARMAVMEKQLAAALAASPAGEHRLVADARAARGLLAEHFDRGGRGKAADVLRLADDVIDAAGNAVSSGNTGPVRDVIARLTRAVRLVHPGPGDHHYFTQALSILEHGILEAADSVTAPQPSNAPAVGSGQAPAKVVAGSVTG